MVGAVYRIQHLRQTVPYATAEEVQLQTWLRDGQENAAAWPLAASVRATSLVSRTASSHRSPQRPGSRLNAARGRRRNTYHQDLTQPRIPVVVSCLSLNGNAFGECQLTTARGTCSGRQTDHDIKSLLLTLQRLLVTSSYPPPTVQGLSTGRQHPVTTGDVSE